MLLVRVLVVWRAECFGTKRRKEEIARALRLIDIPTEKHLHFSGH
jgi:hypothetical protein